jgi:predicted nucleotidyltransferase component of viral defense system
MAGRLAVSPQVIDHDYVLGCYLHFLGQQPSVQKSWLFKGGTSLQKCHFEEYRFSEDLDFTILESLTETGLRKIVDEAKEAMQAELGITTNGQQTIVVRIEDEYGHESLEARIYYKATYNYGGQDKSLLVQVNRGEYVAFGGVAKKIKHEYSDAFSLPPTEIKVYSLEEVFAEKIRAFSGQRKRAIARDIFDLYHLSKREIDRSMVRREFQNKCEAKQLNAATLRSSNPMSRKMEFQSNWEKNLIYLVPYSMRIDFQTAWEAAIRELEAILKNI